MQMERVWQLSENTSRILHDGSEDCGVSPVTVPNECRWKEGGRNLSNNTRAMIG